MPIDPNDTRMAWAMEAPEWVCLLVRYQNTARFISPVNLAGDILLAFDLSREDYRCFRLAEMTILSLVWSWSILPPAPLFELWPVGSVIDLASG